MRVQNKIYKEKDIKPFIEKCESVFNEQINEATNLLLHFNDLKFLTLSGPSCSGKTTTANRIISNLAKENIKVFPVSLDDFFRDRDILLEGLPEGVSPDYDSYKATNRDLLIKCLESLFDGKITQMPRYEFIAGKITEYYTLDPNEYDLILFEGIQAVYPQITEIFNEFKYLSLYINVPEDICTNGSLFKGKQVRLMRRLVRDYHHRGADPEFTFLLWENVVKNERKNITPYAKNSYIHLSSLLDYEINVIKKPVLEVLSKMKVSDPHYKDAEELIYKLENVQVFDKSYVPDDSVYQEFIRTE